jgi:hypothetical protein
VRVPLSLGVRLLVAGPHIIDISVDPLDQRRRRRRAWLRIGLPVAGVALMIATIFAIALYSYRANRNGALALSKGLLATLEERVTITLSHYLDPAVRAVRIARATVPDGTNAARLPLLDALATSLLREVTQIDDVGFADSDGNYVMVRRGASSGTDLKIVHNTPRPRRITWVHHNAAAHPTHAVDDGHPHSRRFDRGGHGSGSRGT